MRIIRIAAVSGQVLNTERLLCILWKQLEVLTKWNTQSYCVQQYHKKAVAPPTLALDRLKVMPFITGGEKKKRRTQASSSGNFLPTLKSLGPNEVTSVRRFTLEQLFLPILKQALPWISISFTIPDKRYCYYFLEEEYCYYPQGTQRTFRI